MAFCRDCGNDIGTDKFCSKCGTEDKANPKTKPRIIDRSQINKYCEGYFKEMANDKKSLIIESDIPLYLNAIDKLDDEQFQSFRKELTRRRKVTELNKFLNIDIEGGEEKLILELKNINYKIPLICVEIFLEKNKNDYSILNYKNIEAVTFLENHGYYLVSVCGPSLIFCDKEIWIPFSKL